MSETNYRFWSRYSREYLYEPDKKAVGASISTFILIILLTALVITPQIYSIRDNLFLISQRKTALTNANEKHEILTSLKDKYQKSLPYKNKIDMLIPNNVQLPDFLRDLSTITARNGYQIGYLSPISEQTKVTSVKETKLNLVLSGDTQRILELIKDLESFDRFVGVTYLDVSKNSIYGSARINITIYSLEK